LQAVLAALAAAATMPAAAAQEPPLPASRLVDLYRFTALGERAPFTFVQAGGGEGERVLLLDHRGVRARAELGPALDDGRHVVGLGARDLEPGVQVLKACSETTCSLTVHIVFDGPVDGVVAALLGRRATADELATLAGRPVDEVARLVAAAGERPAGIVRELYHVHLGREPDPAGLRHWVEALAAGTTTDEVAAALCGSEPRPQPGRPERPGRCWPVEEALGPGSDAGSAGASFADVAATPEARAWVVRRVFQALLGREPELRAVEFWSSTLSGTVASDALLVGVLGSDEFVGNR
jgi:hypothetical protein